MYRFLNIHRADNQQTVTAECLLAQDMACFNGHFDNLPIMPAVAQIEMIRALMQAAGRNTEITGGTKLKFSGLIQPGDHLFIQLRSSVPNKVDFIVKKQSEVVTKGVLQYQEVGNG